MLLVAGARPNFVKVAALARALNGRADYSILNTNQHFSDGMSKSFIAGLGIDPAAIFSLEGTGNDLGRIHNGVRSFLAKQPVKPSVVCVVGDVLSTLAAALAAKYEGLRLAHVEAGLRSFDLSMPEEINRMVVDRLSDLLFCSEMQAVKNLSLEGVDKSRVHMVGNVMIDSLRHHIEEGEPSGYATDLVSTYGEQKYALATLHRPSNVDTRRRLTNSIRLLESIQRKTMTPIVCPLHPRTRKRLHEFGIGWKIAAIEPLPYRDMLHLMKNAYFVVTDSGGVQEETTALHVPCFTLRDSTERPVTCLEGSNRVVGLQEKLVIPAIIRGLQEPVPTRLPLYWDGKAAVRIVDILLREERK